MKKLKLLLFLLLMTSMAGLAACGKSSLPEPYEGSGYPHTYPRH